LIATPTKIANSLPVNFPHETFLFIICQIHHGMPFLSGRNRRRLGPTGLLDRANGTTFLHLAWQRNFFGLREEAKAMKAVLL
jgi:hypothetical protein